MKPNTIYLLGAGASYQAMPIQLELAKDALAVFTGFYNQLIEDRKRWPEGDADRGDLERYCNHADYLTRRLDRYIDIMAKCLRYPSVDTLAKEYFLSNQLTLLKEVRSAVDLYFHIRQFQKDITKIYGTIARKGWNDDWSTEHVMDLDPRYLGWLTSIASRESIKSGHVLPSHVNVVSYNYDLQVEEAICVLGQYAMKDYIQKTPRDGIYHLNGIASLSTPYRSFAGRSLYDKKDPVDTQVSYAWDGLYKKHPGLEQVINEAEQIIAIGYSFPVYNRELDRQILGRDSLRRIYVQGPENGVSDMKIQVGALLRDGHEVEVLGLSMTSQFYIPHNLV